MWDKPELAHFLDCGFNYQLMEEFNKPPFDQVTSVLRLFFMDSLISCILLTTSVTAPSELDTVTTRPQLRNDH